MDSICDEINEGFVIEENRLTVSPFLPTRNFVKFHFILFDPKNPLLLDLRCLYMG